MPLALPNLKGHLLSCLLTGPTSGLTGPPEHQAAGKHFLGTSPVLTGALRDLAFQGRWDRGLNGMNKYLLYYVPHQPSDNLGAAWGGACFGG